MKEHEDIMLDFSIIIPVYKVEKYITKCIQSLLDQTHQNFEVLLVDDGSPDNSIEIARKLVGNDSRFIFLEKENGGQASARNLGLDHAKGECISFLDSDDYFENSFLEKIFAVFKAQPNIDIVICGYQQVEENGDVIKKFMPVLNPDHEREDVLFAYENIDYNVWNKVYRRSVWENQRFIEGIIYEDKEILPRLLYKKQLYLLEEYLCCYVRREGSTMNSYAREKSVSSVLFIYREYKRFLESHYIYEQHCDYYQKAYIRFCFFRQLYMISSFSANYVDDCAYLMNRLDNTLITNSYVKQYYGLFSKQFISLILFKISPRLFKVIYELQQSMMKVIKGSK
ncbi:glycosyltransferase family 2 protein [Wohlfahrtiimonas populi]|uniref:glycosyltransferase family 2 protein n=1 Tax=Wohlfahrtiimonas populi TaxID=1940240 RepID=UPI0013015750|nr:glycosyltransferase family 2 protein [Wohlfahrtiimonas populi]